MSETLELYERARKLIPGGTQLSSKRPEQFLPGRWPAYYRRAAGVEVEDLDGRRYVDVSLHALGACPLGYADPDVDRAAVEAIRAGGMCTLNAPEEVELAELLCELHPWADMVRYARTGGEAMAVAVRIARAATGRDRIAFSGYHGWHDWYLAANLLDPHALDTQLLPELEIRGVPSALSGTAIPFAHGEPLDTIVDRASYIAAIVLEPAKKKLPPDGWLDHVKSTAARIGAVLIFDEITSGFRMHPGGLHQKLGVAPDIAVFAKALSNGYPMAAVLGRRAVMEAAERTFISSTYWTDRIGPAAALATIRKLREHDVPAHLSTIGERMRAGWAELAATHGLDLELGGLPPLPSFQLRAPSSARALHTYYTQEMLAEGFLASNAFYASWAHRPEHIDQALAAADRSFAKLRAALDAGDVLARLSSPIAQPGRR